MLDFGIVTTGSVSIYVDGSTFKAVHWQYLVVGEKVAIVLNSDKAWQIMKC